MADSKTLRASGVLSKTAAPLPSSAVTLPPPETTLPLPVPQNNPIPARTPLASIALQICNRTGSAHQITQPVPSPDLAAKHVTDSKWQHLAGQQAFAASGASSSDPDCLIQLAAAVQNQVPNGYDKTLPAQPSSTMMPSSSHSPPGGLDIIPRLHAAAMVPHLGTGLWSETVASDTQQPVKRAKLSHGTLAEQQRTAVPAQQQQPAPMPRLSQTGYTSASAAHGDATQQALSSAAPHYAANQTNSTAGLPAYAHDSPIASSPAPAAAIASPAVKLEVQPSMYAADADAVPARVHALPQQLLQQFHTSANLDSAGKQDAIADLIAAVADERYEEVCTKSATLFSADLTSPPLKHMCTHFLPCVMPLQHCGIGTIQVCA